MMFDPSDRPRVFGLPPGADFATALVDGLAARTKTLSPADLARVEIFVNTSRVQRRLRDVFDAGPARLLPRIRLITDLAMDPASVDIPLPVSPLRRRLELSQFVAALLTQEPELAPRAALYDLSDSLAKLMDEMQGEGVSPDTITGLDVSDQSGHWERALRFLGIIRPFFDITQDAPDKEARQRLIIEALVAKWAHTPPDHPIIVAGSTGSRGATSLFMQAVAKLPQGAIVLPGFDFDLPTPVWDSMDSAMTAADHPQFRFHTLIQQLDITHNDVAQWSKTTAPNPSRNRLISLSLRPAPVTDQWLTEGPGLGDLMDATNAMTLVEAASPRAEADTIALRLRQAAEDGITAALITPDRMLTRQVAAALDRWNVVPDDSAGTPLALSPPGRLLRHTADLFGKPLTGEALLVILKHPLCHSGADRGPHLLRTRELELHLRRYGPPFPTAETLASWAEKTGKNDHGRDAWAAWLGDHLTNLDGIKTLPITEQLATHIALTETLAAGPDSDTTGDLWDESAGREARRICDMLIRDADAGGEMTSRDYAALFSAVLNDGVVRNRDAGHPNILIWGTLEARVQGADLVILGGMNEGVWPEAPAPDPWLNRALRAKSGLLLPERRIGLSAHDYQQAIAGAEVWITRARRSADAETVPSRWVNRLTNLLRGLPEQNGDTALDAMRARGNHWSDMAAALSEPTQSVQPAGRPSPRPPPEARPTDLSVTRIKTLIRDPFSIYAEKILRLKRLDPLVPQADAPLRGVIIHSILEDFIKTRPDANDPAARDLLMEIAENTLTAECPWPTIRAQWLARMDRSADPFLLAEAARQAIGDVLKTEVWGEIIVGKTGVKLTCKADRIDQSASNAARIYDYKTGQVPTVAQQAHFDKQLLLEAAMVARGAFQDVPPMETEAAVFLGINTTMKDVSAPLEKHPPDTAWAGLETLLTKWQAADRGYTARLALFQKTDFSPYDHLSRFGEWDMSDEVSPEDLT